MRENENSIIKGNKIVLVPYEAFHVPRYHQWMESEELREQTASERLSLEEEYDMQRKWREDKDKCTFIILDRKLYEEAQSSDRETKETNSMVGDVNLFFEPQGQNRMEGEVEIMIAEPTARGKGFGKEALCSMMRYGHEVLKTQRFTSKIGCANKASLSLFESLGFKQVSVSEVFQEVTLALDVTDEQLFHKWTSDYRLEVIK